MEKAVLLIRKSKKGKLIAEVKIGNKQPMAIQERFVVSMNMNEKECEVEKDKGQIKRVVIEGKDLELKSAKNRSNKNNNYQKAGRAKNIPNKNANNRQYQADIFTATAPYNFVPLNENIALYKKPDSFDKYYGNTGYIDLEIESLTPIYIRGVPKKDGNTNSDFYKQAGKYRIPGSSLRGMIRTMVEIVSWSKFGFYNDSYLYYRSFADKATSIKNEYIKHMAPVDSRGKFQYKMSAGLIYKDGLKYFVIPCRFESIKKIKSRKRLGKSYPEYYNYLKLSKDEYLVVPGKKFKPQNEDDQNDWIVSVDKRFANKVFEISNEDIWRYKNDKNRKAPDITKLSQGEYRPCFYVKWNDAKGGDHISFGHTPLFRISYEKSIGEHIMQKNTDGIDITESIFGNENDFMSRVFFEDAFLQKNDYDKVSSQEKIPKTLLGPKPTSFQLYLEQTEINDIKDLKHYNNQVNIRGNKLYWHQTNLNAWKNSSNPKIDTKIKPIGAGAKFQGRIRFENLRDEELGALLFSLDLPKGLAHKIGMAKPLGLGSIRINSKLYISDRIGRYKSLFAEWNGTNKVRSEKVEQLKNKFEQCILKELNLHEKSLWDVRRLKELYRMLDFEHKPASDKIKYMDLREFKERKILPYSSGVK